VPVRRYQPWDTDIPFGSYLNATYAWYDWALTVPKTLANGDHPLKHDHGANAMAGQPAAKGLVCLGTHWSRGSDPKAKSPFVRAFDLDSGMSILINGTSSMIVPEKYPHQFPTGVEEAIKDERDIMDRARSIIDRAFAVVTIRHEQKPIEWFSSYSGELERIRPQEIKICNVSKDLWDNYRKGGQVHAALDGYWLLLRPLDPGKYTIGISCREPYFAGGQDEYFYADVTYDLTVKKGR